jgi:hypothetical protein
MTSQDAHPETRPAVRNAVERVSDLLAQASLLGSAAYLAVAWSDLPGRVPIHFGLDGRPDDWGEPWWTLFLPLMGLLFYVSMGWVSRRPALFNVPFPSRGDSEDGQRRVARELILALRAVLLVIIGLGSWDQVQVAHDLDAGLGSAFMPVALGSIAALIVVYTVRMARSR